MEHFYCLIDREIQFRDLDVLGHLNNVTLLAYLEDARFAYWRRIATQLDRSWDFILAQINCNYVSPAYLGEMLQVGIRVSWLKNKSFGFAYRVEEKESRRLVATAESIQVFFDYDSQQTCPIPEERRQQLAQLEHTTPEKLQVAPPKSGD